MIPSVHYIHKFLLHRGFFLLFGYCGSSFNLSWIWLQMKAHDKNTTKLSNKELKLREWRRKKNRPPRAYSFKISIHYDSIHIRPINWFFMQFSNINFKIDAATLFTTNTRHHQLLVFNWNFGGIVRWNFAKYSIHINTPELHGKTDQFTDFSRIYN